MASQDVWRIENVLEHVTQIFAPTNEQILGKLMYPVMQRFVDPQKSKWHLLIHKWENL